VHAVDRATFHRDERAVAHSPGLVVDPSELVARQALQPLNTYRHPSRFVALRRRTGNRRASNRLRHMPPAEKPSEPAGAPPLEDLLAMIPYAVTLGMELVSARPEEVVGRLAWREELCTTGARSTAAP
jgi:hypothetical protein